MLTLRLALALSTLAACSGAKTGDSGSENSGTGDSASGDTADTGTDDLPGTALDVVKVTQTECDGDTGGRFCGDERKHLFAEYASATEGILVEDWGVYIGCGNLGVTARALDGVITASYKITDEADCSCLHYVGYSILGAAPGQWKLVARGRDTTVTVPAE